MSASLRVGQTLTLSAAADDPSGALDPNAVDTWSEDSNGAVISLTGNGGTATVQAVAGGTARVTATATDPDGNTVESDPFEVNVLEASDAATVVITASPATGGTTTPTGEPTPTPDVSQPPSA